MANVTLTINGKEVTVPAGTRVLDAAREAGFFIPTFCHDPENPGYGGCRICVVNIKGARTLMASCVTEATNGMVVETESPDVVEARKTIIELLLANHPADCLTCDKNGDCRLQDYAYRYGIRESGFKGEKHSYPIDNSNPYITRDLNKCILCGRCVRTCAQVQERQVIDFAYRGFQTRVAPAMDTNLAESDCVSCARCVAVCPVGALNYANLAGKGRTYEIAKKQVTCSFCDAGCQFDLNYKGDKVVGVSAKAPGQGRPLCLKGRLGMELRYSDQPLTPMLKKDGEFVEVSWPEALELEDVLSKLKELEK
ncbi:NADP-reducing hydrogenase subunit HndC [Pelotomaculum schinkii]|uniref:NADP-reducing hydrogenase subunit HndC n=1 Tax=Pelotomaculum schinkii TaxID=78350 RepID=A0A4Y7R746_9FIRM|nr:2Fe-2S iron-sulfur cluster-binding protein [Pelotomaculum schinkii]TEB04549.1 NADP-reducing hydrogenase subunit HndC [Pelotomaculum schinkii]